MRKRLLACLGVAALAVTAACSGGGTDGRPPAHPHHGPVAASDFNGDGYGDLVVTDAGATIDGVSDAGEVAVVYGSARGANAAHHQVVTQNELHLGRAGHGGFGGHTVAADLDGDGFCDLVVTAGYRALFVLWGGGHGLSGAVRLTGASPVAGDFNGDGFTDLVFSDPGRPAGTLALGPFSRAGTPRRTVGFPLAPHGGVFTSGDRATPSAAGDVNGDGRDDLVVTWSHVYADEDQTPRATVLYPGSADGRLTEGPHLRGARGGDLYGDTPAVADLDHDGFADVVVGLPCDGTGEPATPDGGSRVDIAYGGPRGQRTSRPSARISQYAPLPGTPKFVDCTFGGNVTVGDTDGDGYPDVAFTALVGRDYRDGVPTVLLLRGGRGGPAAKDARLFDPKALGRPDAQDPLGRFAGDIALLDTDRDGSADLAISDISPVVSLLRGGPGGPTAARVTTFVRPDLGLGGTGRHIYGFGR